jgi:hypothetical protein
MDKFIKRLQTRASRKGVSVSKSQVREVYQSVVASPESPTDEEISAVIEQLESQYKAPSFEQNSELSVTEKSETIQQQEIEPMTPAQPTAQPSNSTLATSNPSTLSHASSESLSVTQNQIREAVEQQFGRENIDTKTAILNYVAKDTFATAQELQTALSKLRQMRLDIMLKLIADHNSQSSSDKDLLENALLIAASNREKEGEAFFDSFENYLIQTRAMYGV